MLDNSSAVSDAGICRSRKVCMYLFPGLELNRIECWCLEEGRVLGLECSVLLVLGLAQCLAAVSLRPAADLYSATLRLARHLHG